MATTLAVEVSCACTGPWAGVLDQFLEHLNQQVLDLLLPRLMVLPRVKLLGATGWGLSEGRLRMSVLLDPDTEQDEKIRSLVQEAQEGVQRKVKML